MSEPIIQGRRGFLTRSATVGAGIGIGLTAGPLAAQEAAGTGRPDPRDVAILKFLAAAELVESDLWLQYEELAR